MEIITQEQFLELKIKRALKDLRKRRACELAKKKPQTIQDLKEQYKGNEALIKALLKAKKK